MDSVAPSILKSAAHYNLLHQLSQIHPKFKTPFIATVTSGVIMAIMAYALPLTDIAIAAG